MKSSAQSLFIIVVSILIPVVVGFLFFAKGVVPKTGEWVYALPHFNALVNSSSAILLIIGKIQIRRGNKDTHKRLMLTAFFLGVIFLVGYIIYHASVPSTHYGGEGLLKYIYFGLLITHILAAIATVPFVMLALIYALQANFYKHRKVVKYAHPLWLYVAVTGVLVYLLISPYYG